ncbi:MAG: hypothetical protein GKR90_03055 [Pseudomonadales bacterium]|nr:hypothetical protein [Pseudomonadales bacterium]
MPESTPGLYIMTSLATFLLYGYALRLQWPKQVPTSSGPPNSATTQTERTTRWVVLVALLGHAFTCHQILFADEGVRLSLLYVANIVALIITLVVLVAAFRLPVARLFLLVIPISLVVLLLSILIEPGVTAAHALTGPLLAHILISLAAYSALMLAACQSVLLAILDKRLKTPGKQTSQWMPPLETMEQLLVAMLWIGLTLLTASIISGFLFLDDMFAQNVSHHIVITSLSWLVYAFFLTGRYAFGWRGLTAVRWTLVAFALLVVGYLGSKFVLEYILQR